MPYDPTLPQVGTEIDAVQMRSQFTGLKDLIDAILTITAAQIDSAIVGTSNNSNAVATLDSPLADPDDEALRVKVNELIASLRR